MSGQWLLVIGEKKSQLTGAHGNKAVRPYRKEKSVLISVMAMRGQVFLSF